jgi:adenine-specific DNA-methyltransferase
MKHGLNSPMNSSSLKEELKVDLSNYLEDGKNKTVTGLITLLNKYIFTVAENTPIEEDVALDPELLGNVFENLLGAYLPESASTARKASGSYYTPKEIVNYMVDESLIYYFQTSLNRHDEDFLQNLRTLLSYDTDHNPFQTEPKLTKKFIDTIETIKVLDPACGSGAFPMAILNKLTHLLHKLDPENKVWKEKLLKKIPPEIREETEKSLENKSVDYIRKLGLIENCIYGVDIQTIAIQISKLRFFLSLLIEQTIDDAKPNRDIRALPNLETKFIAANTLLALNLNERGLAHTEEVEKLETELFKIREELFYANSRQKKLKLQEQEKKIREQLKQVLCTIGLSAETTDKIANWDPFDQHQSADWFDPEWMFGIKDGFNIVIGNPPYIQLQKNQGKLAKLYKEQGFQTFERTGDIYCLFYEKGIELLKDYGILCYITSNKWMRAGYGEKTRNFFCKHYPLQLIDLGSGIFESATVDTNILIIQKTPQKPQHYALKALDISKEKHLDSLDTFQNRWITLKNLSAESWTISNPIEQRIKEKIERIGKPLKDWDIQINYGIKTGYNEAFIIDGATKERLIAQDPKSAEIIKPLLRGRDIKRYKAEFADLWLINSHNGIREKGIPRIDVKKDYPAIYAHLKQYEPQLKKRQDKGDHWTNLRNCAYLEEFEKEKIIYIEIQTDNKEDGYDFPCFHYDDRKTVVLNTAYIMTGKEIKYILGVLNSTFGRHLVKNYVVRLSERQFRMLAIHVNQFPIPMLSESEQKPFVALVEKILAGKERGEDTTGLEREIDEMVYRLYGLSAEEIAVVEGR